MNSPEEWFKLKGWKPFPFQIEVWKSTQRGESGLISVPTGAGKTYAAYLGPLFKLDPNVINKTRIIYVTPLRALARDVLYSLQQPIQDLHLPFEVGIRTGDTPYSQRKKQRVKEPDILITTPESLAILLSYPESIESFQSIECIIIDEWHELLFTKRGLLLELLLSRLRTLSPKITTWGLSATLGDLPTAAQAACGIYTPTTLITTPIEREIEIASLLPDTLSELPLSGMFGTSMLPYVIQELNPNEATLIFTNTRSQAEKWYQMLIEAKPEWNSILRLHHGSQEKKERSHIEEGLKTGDIKIVVCTSSLDLGVDFPFIEKVIQLGSPKSVARLLQRAGRSSHRPLATAKIFLVPTHALELVELFGLRLALKEKEVEKPLPLKNCYDVLIQHMVTCALGGGFSEKDLFKEVTSTYSYQTLTKQEFQEALFFLTQGGQSLKAYPEYHKIIREGKLYIVKDKSIGLRHRMNIGTIVTSSMVQVKLLSGKKLGFLDEEFIAKLDKNEAFHFGGRLLELVQLRDMVATVKLSRSPSKIVPSWGGKFFPLSSSLSNYLRKGLDLLSEHETENKTKEQHFLNNLLDIQRKKSAIPHTKQFLIEQCKTREGYHTFFYPIEGKAVHEGLAALIIYRLTHLIKATYHITTNDYGFEILSSKEIPLKEGLIRILLDEGNLEEEISEGVNLEEMCKRKFRDIAKIAGLVFTGYPGRAKSARQLQVSTSLLYEVFRKYESHHLLLREARKEVLAESLEIERLKQTLKRLRNSEILLKQIPHHTPFSLPLLIERVSYHISTESLLERIEQMRKKWTS